MVKYFAMALALVASSMIADQAQAFGHRNKGCSGGGCSTGGCQGGSCSVPMTSEKQAAATNAPPGLSPAAASAPAVVSTQSAPNYYASNARRGLFGRR